MKRIILLLAVFISTLVVMVSALAEINYDSFDQGKINEAFDQFFDGNEKLPTVQSLLKDDVISDSTPNSQLNAQDTQSNTPLDAEGNNSISNLLTNELQEAFNYLNGLQVDESTNPNKAQTKKILSEYVQSKEKWKTRFVFMLIVLLLVIFAIFMRFVQFARFEKRKKTNKKDREYIDCDNIDNLKKMVHELQRKNTELEQQKQRTINQMNADSKNKQRGLCSKMEMLLADNNKLEYDINRLMTENNELKRKLGVAVKEQVEDVEVQVHSKKSDEENWKQGTLSIKNGKVIIEEGKSVEIRYDGLNVYVRPNPSVIETSVKRRSLSQYFDFIHKGYYEVKELCILERTLDNYKVIQKGKIIF